MVLINQFVLRNDGLSAGCTHTHCTFICLLNALTKRDKLKCFAICDIKVFFLPDRPHSAAGTSGALWCHRSQAVWCHRGSWAWQQIPADARQLSGKCTLIFRQKYFKYFLFRIQKCKSTFIACIWNNNNLFMVYYQIDLCKYVVHTYRVYLMTQYSDRSIKIF